MNKRLWELYEQSIIGLGASGSDVIDTEKFAELIIKECVNLAISSKYDLEKFNDTDDFNQGHNTALDFMVEGIKQHFGVKE